MSKPTDLWETPSWLPRALFKQLYRRRFLSYDGSGLVLDVCATPENAKFPRYLTEEQDGLATSWGDGCLCWCNPPYSSVMPWVNKAIDERNTSGNSTVMLLKNDTSPAWFAHCVAYADAIVWLYNKRVKFTPPPGIDATSNNFSSVVVVFDPVLHLARKDCGIGPYLGLINLDELQNDI